MKDKTCYCCGKKINEKEDCFYWDNTEPREAMCINCLVKMTSKYKEKKHECARIKNVASLTIRS